MILMAGWCGRLGFPTPCVRSRSAEAPWLATQGSLAPHRYVRPPPKQIQAPLGHSSIATTFDRYGHLLPGMDETLAENMEWSDGRLSSDGIARRP